MKRLLFSFLFVLTAIAGWAQEPTEFTEGHFNYVETDAVNHYVSVAQNDENKPSGAVVIPSSVTHDAVTYTVTSIADNGFGSNEDITEVTIPSTVTSIGEGAFWYCSKLTTITLSSTLTTIGNSAFLFCSSLASFSVPGSVTTIGSAVFDNCSIPTFTFEAGNTAITCNSIIPCTNHLYLYRDITPGVEPISNTIKSLTIGANVTTIYNSMFIGSHYLNSIDFSEATGLTSIGDYAFYDCGNYVPTDPEEDPVPNLTTIDLSNTKVTSIGEGAFYSCSKLTTITLPSTLTTIENSAFRNCSSLTSFSVPGSVTTIGSMVFDNCSIPTFTFEASNTAITCSATIPCTNLYLGRDITFTDNGFSGVSALTIGTNVTSIGSLFYNSNITSVTVPWDSPITIADDAFSDDTYANATLWIPGGTKAAYDAADGWRQFANMDFSSFVVSITGSAHGTLAVGEISSTNNETATTLIDRGENAVFTVTPATGYELTNFTVNSVAQTPTAGQYTVEDLSADQTVVAGFTPIEYDLTLTLNDGTASNPATYTIETTTFTLNNPTKAGYDFAGWKLNGVGEAMMTVTIAKGSTGHLAYTATWTPIVYNIALTLDGGEAENPSTYTIESAAITLNNPTKTGHTFKGWKLNGEGVAMMEVTIAAGSTGHLAYTATWQVNQYTITFNSNGGTGIDAIKLDYGTEVEAPANPTRIGYTFAGWLPEVPATIPAEDITCVAQWTINQYTITFNTAGGSDIAPIVQDYATAVVAPANPTRDGYTFAGWDKDIPTNIPAENVTITATWTPVNYTISYELDGGNVDGVNPTSYTIESAPITLINPVKDGYDFAGWTGTGLDAATKNVIIATGNTGNRSYTATWTKKTYTVSITGGGVTADSYTPEYGDNVVLTIMDDPDATLTSLTVNGLEVKESIVDNQYTITSVSGNVSVVATWSSTKEFITLTTSTATFSCEQDLNFTGSELRAYIAAGYSKSENSVLLVRVYDVPANTGLVIRGEEGETYKISYSTSHSYFVNLLKEHLTSDDVPITSGDYNNYVLKRDADVYKWQRPTSGTMKLGTKKAYLQLPSSFMPAAARELNLVFEDDSTTDISKFVLLNNGKAGERIYNLNGQQVDNMRKGVYIVNGRKVMK